MIQTLACSTYLGTDRQVEQGYKEQFNPRSRFGSISGDGRISVAKSDTRAIRVDHLEFGMPFSDTWVS